MTTNILQNFHGYGKIKTGSNHVKSLMYTRKKTKSFMAALSHSHRSTCLPVWTTDTRSSAAHKTSLNINAKDFKHRHTCLPQSEGGTQGVRKGACILKEQLLLYLFTVAFYKQLKQNKQTKKTDSIHCTWFVQLWKEVACSNKTAWFPLEVLYLRHKKELTYINISKPFCTYCIHSAFVYCIKTKTSKLRFIKQTSLRK